VQTNRPEKHRKRGTRNKRQTRNRRRGKTKRKDDKEDAVEL
jgi:hypothetical protein